MASGEQIALNPSRYNLNRLDQQLKASRRGHQVLKQKADLIRCRLYRSRSEAKTAEASFEDLFREGMFALAEAKYVNRHFKHMVLQATLCAPLTVVTTTEQVAGVNFEKFHSIKATGDLFPHLGLSCGAEKISKVKVIFAELIQMVIRITTIKAAELKLEEAFKATARRLNSLEFVMIPNMVVSMRKMEGQIEEAEREDFARIKWIKMKKRTRQTSQAGIRVDSGDDSRNIFSQCEDPDVIF